MKFEINKAYQMRSPGDADCIWQYVVIDRTAKFVKLAPLVNGVVQKSSVRVGAKQYGDSDEFCFPLGRYSLAPVLSADRKISVEWKHAPLKL